MKRFNVSLPKAFSATLILSQEYIGTDGIDPYILAAWTHFAFVNIHPFMHGNGRMSRLLVSLVLVGAKLVLLLVRVEDKLRYFNALRAADGGDVLDLASFIAGMQIQSKLFLLAEKVRSLM